MLLIRAQYSKKLRVNIGSGVVGGFVTQQDDSVCLSIRANFVKMGKFTAVRRVNGTVIHIYREIKWEGLVYVANWLKGLRVEEVRICRSDKQEKYIPWLLRKSFCPTAISSIYFPPQGKQEGSARSRLATFLRRPKLLQEMCLHQFWPHTRCKWVFGLLYGSRVSKLRNLTNDPFCNWIAIGSISVVRVLLRLRHDHFFLVAIFQIFCPIFHGLPQFLSNLLKQFLPIKIWKNRRNIFPIFGFSRNSSFRFHLCTVILLGNNKHNTNGKLSVSFIYCHLQQQRQTSENLRMSGASNLIPRKYICTKG